MSSVLKKADKLNLSLSLPYVHIEVKIVSRSTPLHAQIYVTNPIEFGSEADRQRKDPDGMKKTNLSDKEHPLTCKLALSQICIWQCCLVES